MTAGVTTPGIDAALARGGRISGRVTGTDGGGLESICVAATPVGGGVFVPGIRTNSTGRYKVTGLPTGSYRVQFGAFCLPSAPSEYLSEYYDDHALAQDANPVPVTAPSVTTGIHATLLAGGSISGQVTADVGGAGLGNICVSANATASFGSATTAPNGTYTHARAPTGLLHRAVPGVCSARGLRAGVLRQRPHPDRVDARRRGRGGGGYRHQRGLAVGASISGTVSADSDGALLAGMCVAVSSAAAYGSTQTAPNGTYRVGGLAAGDYRVQFYDCFAPADYLSEFYDDSADYAGSDVVTLATGENRVDVDAGMALGGVITGKVTAGGEGRSPASA